MRITELIEKKKRGLELTEDEIIETVKGYTNGTIEDYHMSALAMAICFQGMTDAETAALTFAMANSGDMIDLSIFGDLTADKHSTGGVGDKTSLIIGPIVATLGAKVAKMSGRGLGHTGGTIDKLESIKGYRTALDNEEFISIVRETGIALCSANKNLAPADKKLYALRDVTATVDSIPLIASSVMSKKIASGAKNIVLDVKCGSGAFMKDLDSARQLAERMVSIGKKCKRNICAIITDMNTPLGYAIGNSIEVKEAISVLKNRGPADLYDICVILSAELLSLVFGGDWTDAVKKVIADGSAYNTFVKWIEAQSGDLSSIESTSTSSFEVYSRHSGYISSMDSQLIGEAAMTAGAGRLKVTDVIDHSAGILLAKKNGDYVSKGELIATIYSSDKVKASSAERILLSAYKCSDTPIEVSDLILGIIK